MVVTEGTSPNLSGWPGNGCASLNLGLLGGTRVVTLLFTCCHVGINSMGSMVNVHGNDKFQYKTTKADRLQTLVTLATPWTLIVRHYIPCQVSSNPMFPQPFVASGSHQAGPYSHLGTECL